jgi:hypothetical protein
MAVTPKTNDLMAACVGAIWAPLANSSATCLAVCANTLTCAGWLFNNTNGRCDICSHLSTWSSDGPFEWTTPRGCSEDHHCLACPGETGQAVIEEFASFKLGNASLTLSKSCNHFFPADTNDIFSTSSPSTPIDLYDFNVIRGPGSFLNPIDVIRPKARVEDIHLMDTLVTVLAPSAQLVNITSTESAAAVAYNADIDGLIVRNVAGTVSAIGFAHTTGSVTLSGCTTKYSYILQEKFGGADETSVSFSPSPNSCETTPDINITRLLAVFGTEYETRYFNDGQYALHTASKTSLLFFFINAGISTALLVVYIIVYKYPMTMMHRSYRPIQKAEY